MTEKRRWADNAVRKPSPTVSKRAAEDARKAEIAERFREMRKAFYERTGGKWGVKP